MGSRVNILKVAFDHQREESFDFQVYQGRTKYGHGFNFPMFQGRSQYRECFGDVLRGIWWFSRPVAMMGAQTLLKAGSKAIKDGATVKEVLNSTLKPTLNAFLGATAEQVANRLHLKYQRRRLHQVRQWNSQAACSLAPQDLKNLGKAKGFEDK